MKCFLHKPLAPLTTLQLGGPAARRIDATTEDEVEAVLREVHATRGPLLVLGGGSNVVVSDRGFPGLVLRVMIPGISPIVQDGWVMLEVGAGESLDALVASCVAEGWSGLACLSGIPGWVGALPVQNVGAYGQEVGGLLVQVCAWDRMLQAWVRLSHADCSLGYRTSVFKRDPFRYVITRVQLRLRVSSRSGPLRGGELTRRLGIEENAEVPLATLREAVLALRREKGMVVSADDPESQSVGSFFLNPTLSEEAYTQLCAAHGEIPRFVGQDGLSKLPAAWLIERAGFAKGYTQGPVGVSRKHALALVHRGGGTTQQLLTLAREVRDAVQARFGITLFPEPTLVGEVW